MRTVSIFTLLLLAVLTPLHPASANVIGTGTQNFNPITSGLDFVTVQSSETLKPAFVNAGLFLNYAVNTLPYFQDSTQSRFSVDDTLLTTDLNVGIGIMKNWDAGFSMPFILAQTVSDTGGFRGLFSSTGGTEFRINSKYRLFGDDDRGIAVIGTVNFNRVTNDPYAGIGADPTYNLEVAADTKYKDYALAANLGYRMRNSGAPIPGAPIEPLKNQLIASVAASRLAPKINTKLIAEVFGAVPTEGRSSDIDRSHIAIEFLGGAKIDLTPNLAGHAGFGTELANGVASPDWRVYTGINYTFGPIVKVRNDMERRRETPNRERFVVKNILFKYDSDEMIGDYHAALSELVDYLKSIKWKELVVEGHTDSMGGDEYNQQLSQRRASAIRKYLTESFKLESAKMKSVGFGETRPIADNGNYQGRQANRRVEFTVEQ
jgi:outer membrane protein OmpA-like peptidoglycan-associated protein